MYLIDLVCFDDLTVKQCRIETEEAKDEFLVHCLFDEELLPASETVCLLRFKS